MNREGKKCVLYPRVSTEMQVDGYSLEGQKNGLKRFADREEMEIVGIYEDAGKSGKSIEGRPAFKKMLSDIKNGLEIDYILVYKLSRFGRNAADILNSLEFVQSYGINLICIEEGIDSSQTSGKLLISVLSAVAEIERENIIEQTMNGRREKARQGGWNGGFAPYGYYLKDNQLLIEETEAEAIRIIFDKFANSDIGLGGVAKYLNLQGIKKIPRQNGTLETWSSHFIRLILDNPVYCGKIAYGRRTREKVKGTKNEYKQVHAEDYILEDGQHEGIISEELWQKVHAKRMATGIKQPSKIGKHNWDNEMYVQNSHKMVMDIKRTARSHMLSYQKKVTEFLSSKKLLVAQGKVKSALSELEKRFKYYRLALYTYSLASMMEIMLGGNFKEEYISGIKDEIVKLSGSYRELFEKSSLYLEKLGGLAVEATVLKGIGTAGKAVGKVIGSIPLVKEGPVDEFLQNGGTHLKKNAIGMEKQAVHQFAALNNSGTHIFVNKMEDMIQIYNHTDRICFDDKQIYLVAN